VTRILLAAAVVTALTACDLPDKWRRWADRRRAGRTLDSLAAVERRYVQRLPRCLQPSGPPAAVVPSRGASGAPPLPQSFRRDSAAGGYFHGGYRFTSGDTVFEVVYGSWGTSSFSGYVARVPNGCVTRTARGLYLVSDTLRYDGRFASAAILLSDTVNYTGGVLYSVQAPRPVLPFLLQVIAAADTAG
jgi:hypothetical protein